MNKIRGLILVLVVAASAAAQQPQPKSQEELDALLAIQNAQGPDERIEAVHNLLTNFKNTEFKEWANFMAMLSYQQKNDFENMLLYGEKTLELNPDNADVMVQLAYAIPARTGEFDLDKEEKLAKAEGYAKKALRLIPTMPKKTPDMPDDEWLMIKKDLMSQVHDSLGLIALKRDDYDAAEDSFRKSLEVASQQGASTFYHLASTLRQKGELDEALGMADKAIAAGGVQAGGRDLAKVLKAEIAKAKAKEMTNPSESEPAGDSITPEVEIVQPKQP